MVGAVPELSGLGGGIRALRPKLLRGLRRVPQQVVWHVRHILVLLLQSPTLSRALPRMGSLSSWREMLCLCSCLMHVHPLHRSGFPSVLGGAGDGPETRRAKGPLLFPERVRHHGDGARWGECCRARDHRGDSSGLCREGPSPLLSLGACKRGPGSGACSVWLLQAAGAALSAVTVPTLHCLPCLLAASDLGSCGGGRAALGWV